VIPMRPRLLLSLLLAGVPAALAPGGAVVAEPAAAAPGPRFVFAVATDPHNDVDAFREVMREIRDLPARDPKQLPGEFVLVAGDLHALEKELAAHRDVFKDSPSMKAFLPMTGDHATEPLRAFMSREILSAIPQARLPDPAVISYTFDWKNVRIIVTDPNHPAHGAQRFLNDAGCKWVEEAIRGTPPEVEHIFIGIHEPPFPRNRHLSEMTDEKKPLRDAFWNMLMRYRSRVRAVFTGHTHYLETMRVADPAGAAANDPRQYPVEKGGIWQIGAGASGARSDFLSFVQVQVEGSAVRFAAYAREGKATGFRVVKDGALTDEPPR
jgi:hypothetical protein